MPFTFWSNSCTFLSKSKSHFGNGYMYGLIKRRGNSDLGLEIVPLLAIISKKMCIVKRFFLLLSFLHVFGSDVTVCTADNLLASGDFIRLNQSEEGIGGREEGSFLSDNGYGGNNAVSINGVDTDYGTGRLRSGAPPRRLMVAMGLGILAASSAALTHLRFGSLKQAAKRLWNTVSRKPISWRIYAWRLPLVNVNDFPDFKDVADGLMGKYNRPGKQKGVVDGDTAQKKRPEKKQVEPRRTFVRVVAHPDEKLSEFLQLSDADKERGIVIKGRYCDRNDSLKYAAAESYIITHLLPSHPLFLRLLSAYRSTEDRSLYLVFPRACCDVYQYYRASARSVIFKLAAAEMVQSLSILHSRGYIHRDIKPNNYFVSQDGHAILSDFEMIWPMGLEVVRSESVQTRGFRAPELKGLVNGFVPFSVISDVYALGMSFARMYVHIRQYQRIPDRNLLVSLITRMVVVDTSKRISLDDVKNDEYFKAVDWGKVERMEYGSPFPLAPKVMRVYDSFHTGL